MDPSSMSNKDSGDDSIYCRKNKISIILGSILLNQNLINKDSVQMEF